MGSVALAPMIQKFEYLRQGQNMPMDFSELPRGEAARKEKRAA
jgi:hypothetical protein